MSFGQIIKNKVKDNISLHNTNKLYNSKEINVLLRNITEKYKLNQETRYYIYTIDSEIYITHDDFLTVFKKYFKNEDYNFIYELYKDEYTCLIEFIIYKTLSCLNKQHKRRITLCSYYIQSNVFTGVEIMNDKKLTKLFKSKSYKCCSY